MIENRRGLTIFSHTMLILGIAVILFPLYVAFVAATLDNQSVFETPMTLIPGGHLLENMKTIWVNGVGVNSAPFWLMMLNSFIMAFAITVGKIVVSMLSAFAIVWFRFPLRNLFFWMIFITLMLPVEVRIFPTVEVIANLKMLDSYAGLTLPLMASATATFLFRQFFMTLPDELIEAARIDGASPMRFFPRHRAAAVENQSCGAVRHHLYLRLEPISVAAADYSGCESWHRRRRYQRHDRHRRRYYPVESGDGGDAADPDPAGRHRFSHAARLCAWPGR